MLQERRPLVVPKKIAAIRSGLPQLDPFKLVPRFVCRLLQIGEVNPEIQQRYQAGVKEVWFANHPAEVCNRFRPGHFNGILATRLPDSWSKVGDWLVSLGDLIDNNGVISLVFQGGDIRRAAKQWLDQLSLTAGLLLYHWLAVAEKWNEQSGVCTAILVKADYNPIGHARQMKAVGLIYTGIQILDDIPEVLISDEEILAAIAVEKQQYYLELQRNSVGDPPHSWFSKAQREFAQATAINPDLALPYKTQVAYWRYMGDERTATNVWRTYLQSQKIEPESDQPKLEESRSYLSATADQIECTRTHPDPRILILGHSASDYGMDSLYDGLCRVLGNHQVVEYPMKPMLHGKDVDAAYYYPCTFSHAAGPSDPRDILARLEAGWFDIILYADVVEMRHRDEIRLFLEAAGSLPLVVYDSWDDCYTPLRAVLEYLGRTGVDLIFKREMLAKVDYGAGTHPLPFSYPAALVETNIEYRLRSSDLFWAGKREFGLRPLLLPRIEKLLNRKFDQTFDKEVYISRLRNSRIGLSLFGYGFDTVRFWEIPAHGGLLLAQAPPIRIPHNFSDGQNAILFDDIQELEEKLCYYLAHPQKAAAIATAGHLHWKTYHTTEARARQMLDHIETHCGW